MLVFPGQDVPVHTFMVLLSSDMMANYVYVYERWAIMKIGVIPRPNQDKSN